MAQPGPEAPRRRAAERAATILSRARTAGSRRSAGRLGVIVLAVAIAVPFATASTGKSDGSVGVELAGRVRALAAGPISVTSRIRSGTGLRGSLRSVQGFGDSVPAAAACTCESYLSRLATQLQDTAAAPQLSVANYGKDGLTSASLLSQVVTLNPRATPSSVTVIMIGANDLDESSLSQPGCSVPDGLVCYQATLADVSNNLDAVLNVLQSDPGPRGPIIVSGYWNVFLDGKVGAAQGPAYVRDSDALTVELNAVLQRVAAAHAVTYQDLYRPFKDGSVDRDDTDLLADDGDHPSDAGHQFIAALLHRTLTEQGF